MTKQQHNKRKRGFTDLNPFVMVEEGVLVLKDGRAAIGYTLDCFEEELLNGAAYQSLHESLTQALGALPIDTIVQRMDIYYQERWQGKPTDEVRGYFQLRTQDHFEMRPLLRHRAYLFISIGPQEQKRPNPINTLFSLGKTFYPNPLAGIEKRVYRVAQLGKEFAASLSSQGLSLKQLTPAAYRELYLQYFNLEFDQLPQGVSRQITRLPHGLALGEKQVRMINLIGQGLQLSHTSESHGVLQPYIRPLTHALNFPHILISNYYIEDREKALKALDLQRKVNHSLGAMGNQDTSLQEAEIEQFTEDIRRTNQAVVSVNLCLILWDGNDEELKTKLDLALTAFRKLSGAEALVESMDTLNLFFAQAPGNAFQNYRWLRMPAAQASIYTHFTSLLKSQEGMLLCDRHGYPLEVSLFNTRLNNQNAVVVGPSGSGKSFTIGNFIIQRFEKGNRQIIIDVGGSYKHTIAALQGQYIEYDPEHPLSLNPFYSERIGTSWQLDGDKLIFLITLLARIWKGEQPLSQAEQASLSRMLPLFYQQHQSAKAPVLRDFARWLEPWAQSGPEASRILGAFDVPQFLLCLSPFTDGQYHEILNAEWEEDLSHFPLICFDMARVKDNPILFPIVSLLITDLALTQIRKFKSERKYIYMDEAWSMLSASMGSFVELMYRTIRKNNGAIYIITQGVSEIIHSGVGEAILGNADTKILLIHSDKQAQQKVREAMGLTNHEYDLFVSLRKQETSREICIKQGETAKVFSVEVAPHTAIALSSTPAVRDRLEQITQQKSSNIHHAISQMIEEQNYGQ